MLAHIDHLGTQNTDGTVNGGECLVETGHHTTDYGAFLYHDHIEAAVGTVKGRLHTCDTAADDQDPLIDLEGRRIEGFILHDLGHGHGNLVQCLLCVGFLIKAYPGNMLPDVGHLQKVPVETGLLDGLPERILVHTGRTGGNNDPVKVLPLDGSLDLVLTRFGTGVHIVRREGHTGDLSCLGCYLRDIDSTRDVASTMANKYTNPH